jgi:nitrilase
MTDFPTVRVAAIQATPVVLDAEATVAKAVRLLGEAAAKGVQLAVLPETFVSLYPSNVWARQASGFDGFDELWERLWASSVDVPGPLVDRLTEACGRHDLHCAVGVNERESERPGTLYNALLLIGPNGLISKHRKLMPTHHGQALVRCGRPLQP